MCLENLSFYKLLDHPYLDKWTLTELFAAIHTDDSDRLLLLLNKGANIETTNYYGWTALILAAKWGKVECLKILLEGKADIEVKDNKEYTALIYATMYLQTKCLRVLLQSGTQVDPGLREEFPQYAGLWTISTL